ncbi:glycerol-3-phosphate dehydrogenase (NAD(P)+) [Mycoplasma testudineum]|uniref:Glycerol-3-phosphate dehydrogenase n=1 Tax=Mycoplasma testudineum TaxID=244584 RepID=A0A4V3C2Y6_9MOLU|nr:NAD(P)H-dependent glycerol-3-phosphate dehydrogenase [Mycoplasma testudineum]TDO19899.1 glycerol-3-phosphate dehydrogenase (NAD(P)+) [Mycoplasma testudineum]
MKIAIVGTGAFGTAIGNVLLKNGHKVHFYGVDQKEISDLKAGYNTKYFDGAKLHRKPDLVTNKIAEAITGVDYIILGVPAAACHNVLQQIVGVQRNSKVNIVNLAKGCDPFTGDLLSKTLLRDFRDSVANYAILAGPSFAQEVFDGFLTMVNIASKNDEFSNKVARSLQSENFKIIKSSTMDELQTYSIMKNVYALATGIVNAVYESYNTLTSVLALAFKETTRYVLETQSRAHAEVDFASFGDFVLTGTSFKSRNYTFGYEIGKIGLAKALKKHNNITTEGYHTLEKIVKKLGSEINKYPLLFSLYQVCFMSKPADKLLDFL